MSLHTHLSALDRICAELSAKTDAERAAADLTHCPKAEAIIARHPPMSGHYRGMSGAAAMVLDVLCREQAKRHAAETILHLRRNRAALRAMGRDPEAATLSLLERAAMWRREAARRPSMKEFGR